MNLKYLLVLLIFVTLTASSYAEEKLEGIVTIFHAGSLTLPFAQMEKTFEENHPDVDVRREPAGSLKCARKITELGKPCDIMASSDFKVIDELLVPKYSDYSIRFASNQIVLCYTKTSLHASEITKDNWFNILLTEGVSWGFADPNVDPCGYRSLMTMQLAEIYYKKPGLYDKLYAICPKENIRPKSEDQVALLQTGNLDYAWEYLSVGKQHKLENLNLPQEINLGSLKYNDFYEKAKVNVAGDKPGKFIEMNGDSITYGVTLINDAPNKRAALAFMVCLLDPDGGLKILDDMGQPPIIPCQVKNSDIMKNIPEQIRKLVKPGE